MTDKRFTWSPAAEVNVEAVKAMLPVVGAVVPQARSMAFGKIVDISIARPAS